MLQGYLKQNCQKIEDCDVSNEHDVCVKENGVKKVITAILFPIKVCPEQPGKRAKSLVVGNLILAETCNHFGKEIYLQKEVKF